MPEKSIVVIPTLNENDNIHFLYKNIVQKFKIPILFIDDNSIDGTRDKIKKLSKINNLVKYIFRKKRLGIGSAHKAGIFWSYKKKYNFCVTMDADRTHNPKEIKKIINTLKKRNADIIITTRFEKKSSLRDWPLFRVLITSIRFYLVKIMLNTNLDSSGGYRCYNLKSIKKNDFKLVDSNGYFFLVESLFYFEKLNYKITAISTTLKYRTSGKSKMRFIDIGVSLVNLFKLAFFNKL